MSLSGRQVAVVGGGIGGLAAAVALARRGARVTVLEQAPALAEVGAGLQISANGVVVLEALGLGPRAAAVASCPEAVELREHGEGRLVARVPLGAAAAGGRPYWQFHRADLLAVLADGAEAAGVDIRLGCRVTGIDGVDEGVGLTTDDGRSFDVELAVAADGVRSGLRAAAGLAQPVPPRFTGHVAWRTLVPAAGLPADALAPVARVTMGPGRHLVSYPLRGGTVVNLVAVEEREAWSAEGWSAAADPDEMRRAFAGWGGTAGALLAAAEDCFLWGLFGHAPLPAWSVGRFALLGDACHPMLPFLAQGATQALEDAWVLADALDRIGDPALALASYAARRLPRATRVQRAAARNGRIYHLRPPLAGPAQGALALASARAPAWLAGRFAWLYGHDVTAGTT